MDIQKGRPSPRMDERNKALIEDRDSGMSWRDLAKKYGITDVRAKQIYKAYA